MIEECDGAAHERLQAMGMLNEEIKLWVTRCRQLVGVLQEVEMERDNFKAGEGHAKELGTGFKVKLEDTGNDTRAALSLDNFHLQSLSNALDAAVLQQPNVVELNRKLEESLARQRDLEVRLDATITERDAYRQVMVHEQDITSEYKKRLEQSELSLHGLRAQAEVIAKGQVSPEIDTMGKQSETLHTKTQSPATNTAIRAELRRAQRLLEFTQSSQTTAHHHYTKALQAIYYFVERYTKPAPTNRSDIPESPVSQPEDRLGDMYVDLMEEYGWIGKIMLETQEVEYEESCRRVSFHGHRSRSGPGGGEISHFQSVLGQVSGSTLLPRNWRSSTRARKSNSGPVTLGHIIPSRSDKETFPATWARWDQIYEDANGSPTALLDTKFTTSTRHRQWPEVSLVIYSWSFYKIHDSTWSNGYRSRRLLRALVEIWRGCDSYMRLVKTPDFRIYRRSTPIITNYPHVYCGSFMSEEDSDESEGSTY